MEILTENKTFFIKQKILDFSPTSAARKLSKYRLASQHSSSVRIKKIQPELCCLSFFQRHQYIPYKILSMGGEKIVTQFMSTLQKF